MTLSGVRSYAEGSLELHEKRSAILRRRDLAKQDKRTAIAALNAHVDNLAIVLFTYAMYLKFIAGDKAIKDAVSTFEGLGINRVQIGSMELSRQSRYFDLGRTLAAKLYACIEDKTLAKMIENRVRFFEIADWYKTTL